MTVTVNHEQFQLCKGRFVWPGAVLGASNPLEQPGAALVAELARTGWEVPGIDVEIHTYGSGRAVSRMVHSVSFHTPDGLLRLVYGNRQRDGSYGLTTARIEGQKEVCFYDDGSGSRPAATVAKVKSLIQDVTERLSKIDSVPGHDDVTEEGDFTMRRICHVDPVMAPEDFPVLYAWAERDTAYRLAGYGDDADDPKSDFGLSGNGWRLVSLGASDGGPSDPKYFNGYTYASASPSAKASQSIYRVREDSLPVELRLKWLNEVYVVDNAAFRKAADADRSKALAEGRERMTEDELNSWTLATARTMVPWAEYDGSFEDPVILIGRQTASDEARLMRGPISVHTEGNGVAAVMDDTLTGQLMALFSAGTRQVPYCRAAARAASEAGRLLQVDVAVSPEVADILKSTPQPSIESLLARP